MPIMFDMRAEARPIKGVTVQFEPPRIQKGDNYMTVIGIAGLKTPDMSTLAQSLANYLNVTVGITGYKGVFQPENAIEEWTIFGLIKYKFDKWLNRQREEK